MLELEINKRATREEKENTKYKSTSITLYIDILKGHISSIVGAY